MADWKDIEQLQQDLKRAQESTASQKLSERNCIEILIKLQNMKLLDVIHTMDGKEYLTHGHLLKEIKDELYIHGGRVSLVELQNTLNVDFTHIETKANEIASSSNAIFLVLGQLVDKTYLDHLAEEINDNLQSLGQVKIAELCKTYDLPGDFLVRELVSRLGDIIDGRLDETNKDAIFTEAFIARHKSRVRGVLTAVTRPTALQPIIGECNMSSKLFYTIIEELLSEERIRGDIVGKRSEKSTFLPEMYTRTQNQSVDNFYQQNSYLEYDMLARLGISDGKSYVRRRFNDTVALTTVAVGPTIVNLIAATVEETLSSDGWVDVQPLLPSPFAPADCEQLLNHVLRQLKGRKQEPGIVVDSVLASVEFQQKCKKIFNPLIKKKAEVAAKDATVFALTEEEMEQYSSQMGTAKKKVEEVTEQSGIMPSGGGKKKREKGAAGSGIGGREVKTKGKDKKRLKKQRELEAAMEEEEEAARQKSSTAEKEFMSVSELTEVLVAEFRNDCPDALLTVIAERLHRILDKEYQEQSKSIFQLAVSQQKKEMEGEEATKKGDTPTVSGKKKSRKSYEEEIYNLWVNINLFNAAFEHFSDETANVLRRHLLVTTCTDLVNVLFNMVGSEYLTGIEESSKITPEMRIKILTRLPEEYHTPLKTLHQCLTGKKISNFMDSLSEALSPKVCDVMLKKLDKKRERQILHGYKMTLMQQLEKESDMATALHLAVAIMFQNLVGKMLHMPGKCVPQVILFLRGHVAEEVYEQLANFQAMVLRSVVEEDNQDFSTELPKLRTLAATIKKKASSD